ncbi:MAG: hypothetical protein WC992_03025 [Acholeplasmataceae bacterium]
MRINGEVYVCCHYVAYFYDAPADATAEELGLLREEAKRHAAERLVQGSSTGELCCLLRDGVECRGWYNIGGFESRGRPGDLTPDEQSLLLYLESRLVDHGGMLQGGPGGAMNGEDFDIAERWHASGFIEFDELSEAEVNRRRGHTHRCRFSEEAWRMAHRLRRLRAEQETSTLIAEEKKMTTSANIV